MRSLPHVLSAATDFERLSFNWAMGNKWLVILGILLAGILCVYLYRAQQKIAPKRLVSLLTAIRVALVVLMFVLLAGPVFRMRLQRESAGTLWLVVDQSLSMDHADRQMTPSERLHWADALGLIPHDAREGKRFDRHIASLVALRADLKHLEDRAQLTTTDRDAVARQLRAWNENLQSVVGRIGDQNPSAAPLRTAAQDFKSALDRGKDGAIPWTQTAQKLDDALAILRPLSEEADKKFLAEKQGDPAIQDALAKMAAKKRIELAVATMTQKRRNGTPVLSDVIPGHTTKVVAFADAPLNVAAPDAAAVPEVLKTALKPGGYSTNLAATLQWVGEQTAEGERASVVVVSDGRDNAGAGDLVEPTRLLAARGVRVYSVGVGSEYVVPDATIEQLDAPDWIYTDDTLRAGALLRLDGLAGKSVTVEFRRVGHSGSGAPTAGGPATTQPVQSQTITPTTDRAAPLVTFEDKPPTAGVFEYEIAIKPLSEETAPDNNTRRLRVTVRKDKLNALVIEDQARWEYRYLVNYLERDQRVKVQKVLFEPAQITGVDRPPPVMASPANELPEAQLLPDTLDKWSAFDLIVLGDVPPERLSAQHQEFLAKTVRDRGAGLIVIAGPYNMPMRYASDSAAGVRDLLPVEPTSAWTSQQLADHIKDGFRPVVAPEGAASILSRFTPDEATNAELWSSLPAWYWHSEQTRTKLAASVIWQIVGTSPAETRTSVSLAESRQRALLATMPAGMGRVLYLASDSTWRMRQVAGENLHERFWGQVVRWAVGDDLPAGGRLVRFGTDRPRYVVGEAVNVTARLRGRDMAPLVGKTVKVVAREIPADGKGEGRRLAETTLTESPEQPGRYTAALAALPAGRVELTLAGAEVEQSLATDPTVAAKSLAIDVLPHRDAERANINTDFAALSRIAEAGGGIALRGPHADVLASHLPRDTHTTENVEELGLFSNPRHAGTKLTHWAFLAVFVGLLTAEWVIRKAGGLV